MHSTYKTSLRMEELKHSFDPRLAQVSPKMIMGTGKIFQRTLWLNAADKSSQNVERFIKKKGKLLLTFNDWRTYFDVRVNQLELRSGTDVTVKLRIVKHTTSEAFKKLTIDKRQCRYEWEQEVERDKYLQKYQQSLVSN